MQTLLDNINNLWGDDLKAEITTGAKLKLAASCFSVYAFESLKEELEKIDSLEFIFTAPTFVPDDVTDKVSKKHREFHIPKRKRERNLYGSEFEIQLKNKLTQKAIAKECADWIRKKVIFKSNITKLPMQQFAYLQSEEKNITYMPIHGFTAVELGYQRGDAVSNFITKLNDSSITSSWLNLFNQIWNDESKLRDVTESICNHIESVYRENSPEKIYFFTLYNIFNEFLEDLNDDILPNDLTGYKNTVTWKKLFNFQKDAAAGAISKLENYNGCILADSVGLGKTFTALAVIKYYELRNRSVLVLCPKKLTDNWMNYNSNLITNTLAEDRFSYDVLCHTDLQRTSGESLGLPIDRVNWGNYDLVVIDESHNFRNNNTFKDRESRYQKLMNSVVKAGVKTKVLMLSATPVNNRFSDLKNQLAIAYEGQSKGLSKKLKMDKSIEEVFRHAQVAFSSWSRLPIAKRTPKAILDALDFDFFKLLDSVTIARSRRHIETFYDTKDIGDFPKRLPPLSFHCPLTTRNDVIGLNDIYEHLSNLNLAVYAPISYVLPSRLKKYEDKYDTDIDIGMGKLKQSDREKSLQALMTTNLLKRLESSVEAFRLTLEMLRGNHSKILKKIQRFNESGEGPLFDDMAESMEGIEGEDEDFAEVEEFFTEGKVQINLSDMDLISWQRDLFSDLAIIEKLLSELIKVSPKDDAKLQHLQGQLIKKIQKPINPKNKKILIFTAFADTASYLYRNLSEKLLGMGIHSGVVTGGGTPKNTLKKGYDFQSLLTMFSPISKEKGLVMPEEKGEINVLIGTDCISEGQNLQDCDYLINYDIHWNPVRIIQRFGRIDRIGSTNTSIQLANYWPDISLDAYINLKERVENRMVIADVAATGDDNILSAKANDVSYRTEQLRKLQDEIVELEDLKTGVNITDLGLNDFRMDLLNYIKEKGELDDLPGGLHAVVPPRPELGLMPGAIFVLRNRNVSVNVNRHNRLHPYYLVYIGNDGEIMADHAQVKYLLDLIRNNCKGLDGPLQEYCKKFNKKTKDGRKMDFYSNLLGQAIRSIIEVKEDKDIDGLFLGNKTSALLDPISGLDDFELISFLVIQDK
ncbi:MAG: helicase-related protein [Bacteriovoracales bacterium]|nr:helicase-related protein [Bacteriovoracales bacterium]